MDYTTTFEGGVTVDPPLNAQEIEFLTKFNKTRRMKRERGPYFVDGGDFMGQAKEADVRDYNSPPEGQPGLWCNWTPNEAGDGIIWDGGEKFYDSAEWMKYLIDHFIGADPIAKRVDPERFAFLQGHRCDGEIIAQGEDSDDRWFLYVRNNRVTTRNGEFVPVGDEQEV